MDDEQFLVVGNSVLEQRLLIEETKSIALKGELDRWMPRVAIDYMHAPRGARDWHLRLILNKDTFDLAVSRDVVIDSTLDHVRYHLVKWLMENSGSKYVG